MKSIVYSNDLPDPIEYMKLFETTGWNKKYKANEKELSVALTNSWYVVSAYCEDELVGVGRIVSDGILYAMIYDLIVSPSHQNKGVGDTILSKLIEKCKTAEVKDIQLFSAKGKALFYRKRGFIERSGDSPGMELKE